MCFSGEFPVVFPNGLSSIGFALSASMGMKKALNDRVVVAIHGDGGFLLNCQAMETIRRQGLKVIVVLLTDEAYGMIRSKQRKAETVEVGVGFSNPDFEQLSRSFGWDYFKAGDIDQFEKVLLSLSKNNFDIHAPTVIHLPISYDDFDKKADVSPIAYEESRIREMARYFVDEFSRRKGTLSPANDTSELEKDRAETQLLIREFLRN